MSFAHIGVTLHEAGVGISDKAQNNLALVSVAELLLDQLYGMGDDEPSLV